MLMADEVVCLKDDCNTVMGQRQTIQKNCSPLNATVRTRRKYKAAERANVETQERERGGPFRLQQGWFQRKIGWRTQYQGKKTVGVIII